MTNHNNEQLEAIVIFVDGKIDRELQYPEFEAVMDGFVPLPEFAGGQIQAVYVRVNRKLCITTTVFFLADFDGKGMINRRWNVPLRQLADCAHGGPDLGAGRVNLACYSQCPIDWQQKKLWDPIMEPGRNSFVLMRKSIAANRLGLIFPEAAPEPEPPAPDHSALKASLAREYDHALRNRLAQTLKEQRLHINTLKSRMSLKIDALKREHQSRLDDYKHRWQKAQGTIKSLEEQLRKQSEQLDMQCSKAQGLRDYYEHKLSAARLDGGAQVEALEQSFAEELKDKVNEAVAEQQQLIDMRDMELFYRQQQEQTLREQLQQLQAEYDSILERNNTQALQPLQQAGISFVSFQPGAGQLTLSPEEVESFMANTAGFVAKACGVSEEIYRLWLDHYHSPYCTATTEEGDECGAGVKRVNNPADFHPGETNRCQKHSAIHTDALVGRG